MRRAIPEHVRARGLCRGLGHPAGATSSIVSGVAESTGTVVGLTQDLSKCDLIGAAEVTFDEERTIGGAVALDWVQLGRASGGRAHRRRGCARESQGAPASRTRHGTSSTST